jgi:hypothetical protein
VTACCAPLRPLVQKERRLTGLHPDIEELLFDPDFKGAVGASGPLAAQKTHQWSAPAPALGRP